MENLKSTNGLLIDTNKNQLSPFQEKILKVIVTCLDENRMIGTSLKTDMQDIGLDSITFIKIVVALEEKFDFEFDDEMLLATKFPNIRELIEYVESKIKSEKVE